MNPGLGTELSGSVQLIVTTVLPALAVLVLLALLARGLLSQDMTPSAPAAAPGSATAGTLAQVFGPEHVAIARSLVVQPVQELLGTVDKFGGHPTGVRREHWPKCAQCGEPLTFVGQLRAGPAAHIPYPTEGLLQMFACSARAPRGGGGACDSSDPRRGAARVRFAPLLPTDVTLGEDAWERESLAGAVRRNTAEERGGRLQLAGIEKVGRDGRVYFPYLARQYAVVSVELLPSVRLPLKPTSLQVALWTNACTRLRVQVGGHYAWSRREPDDKCGCGAPFETVLQLDPLDEVLTIPVAARITVQACAARHAPDAFRLFWQAP